MQGTSAEAVLGEECPRLFEMIRTKLKEEKVCKKDCGELLGACVSFKNVKGEYEILSDGEGISSILSCSNSAIFQKQIV